MNFHDRHGRSLAGHPRTAIAGCLSLLLAGCMVGPDYKRPDTQVTPVAFKELAGWKISQPADTAPKGDWWSVYHDPLLDRLERVCAKH